MTAHSVTVLFIFLFHLQQKGVIYLQFGSMKLSLTALIFTEFKKIHHIKWAFRQIWLKIVFWKCLRNGKSKQDKMMNTFLRRGNKNWYRLLPSYLCRFWSQNICHSYRDTSNCLMFWLFETFLQQMWVWWHVMLP